MFTRECYIYPVVPNKTKSQCYQQNQDIHTWVSLKTVLIWFSRRTTRYPRKKLNFYRPQRSCGQGNVFTGVCLSTGGGGCLPQCMLGCQTPSRDQADTPLGPGRHPPTRQTPWDQADPPEQADTPWTRQTIPRTRQTPREADSSIWSTSSRYASYWNAFLFYLSLPRRVSSNDNLDFRRPINKNAY